jgi:hypothetical protein
MKIFYYATTTMTLSITDPPSSAYIGQTIIVCNSNVTTGLSLKPATTGSQIYLFGGISTNATGYNVAAKSSVTLYYTGISPFQWIGTG